MMKFELVSRTDQLKLPNTSDNGYDVFEYFYIPFFPIPTSDIIKRKR